MLAFVIRIYHNALWKVTGHEGINLEERKIKFRWIGHTLQKVDREIPKAALLWNPQGNRKRGRPRNSWRRSVIKEPGRSRTHRQPVFLEGTMDSIIIIIIIIFYSGIEYPFLNKCSLNFRVHKKETSTKKTN